MQTQFNSYARVIESGRSLFSLFALIAVFSIAGISQLRIDDDFVSYFDDSSKFRVDTDFATEALAGPYGVEIVISATDGNDIFTPPLFSYLSKIGSHLAQDPRVRNSLSIYDILNSAKDDIQPTDLKLEQESSQYLAQLFLAYEFSLLKDQSTSDFVDISQTSTRISVLLNRATSTEIRNFVSNIQSWHESNSPQGIGLNVTGESVPTAYLSPSNIEAMIVGILISLIISAGIIGLYYRSMKIALTALLSILVPVSMGFGIWGWIYGSIGLATTVVVAITIGVVIDDSIHMIVRAMDGHHSLDLDGERAAAYSVYRVGVAIVGTTIVLVAAFSVLLASGFELNSAFGACTALILIGALAFDLIALPKLLAWITPAEVAT